MTAAEQVFFDGAHLSHVVLYYEHLRSRRNQYQMRARTAELARVYGSGRGHAVDNLPHCCVGGG